MANDVDPATGEILFHGPPPWICGRCGTIPMMCRCETSSRQDLVLTGLPPPPPTATSLEPEPDRLLNRFISCISVSPTMAKYDARRWMSDHGATTLRALQDPGARGILLRLVDAYRTHLTTEPIYAKICTEVAPMWLAVRREGGWSDEAKAGVVRGLLESAVRAFLAGDWNCVTRVGSLLLVEAFPLRDEWDRHEVLRERGPHDSAVECLFDAAMFVHTVLSEGYSGIGGSLAVEDSLDGACPARWYGWYREFIAAAQNH